MEAKFIPFWENKESLVIGKWYAFCERIEGAESNLDSVYWNYNNRDIYGVGQFMGWAGDKPIFKEENVSAEDCVNNFVYGWRLRYVYDLIEWLGDESFYQYNRKKK